MQRPALPLPTSTHFLLLLLTLRECPGAAATGDSTLAGFKQEAKFLTVLEAEVHCQLSPGQNQGISWDGSLQGS